MDIKSLYYFVTVVESTSISKAARKLHISQPPLSLQIKALEEELGVILMERGAKNITLTYAGKVLYHRAKTILNYQQITKQELKNIGIGLGGSLRLGMISSCEPTLIPKIISGYSNEYPDIQFEIFENNTYGLFNALDNNLIELAFVRIMHENIDQYNNIEILHEPLVAFAKKDYFINLPDKYFTIEALNDVPLIMYRRWQNILTKYFESNSCKPLIKCINDDARTCINWAAAGLGIAIVPESMCSSTTDNECSYLPLSPSSFNTHIYALWNKNAYISPALKNFIDNINKYKGA